MICHLNFWVQAQLTYLVASILVYSPSRYLYVFISGVVWYIWTLMNWAGGLTSSPGCKERVQRWKTKQRYLPVTVCTCKFTIHRCQINRRRLGNISYSVCCSNTGGQIRNYRKKNGMDLSREFLGKKSVFRQSVLKQWSLQIRFLTKSGFCFQLLSCTSFKFPTVFRTILYRLKMLTVLSGLYWVTRYKTLSDNRLL